MEASAAPAHSQDEDTMARAAAVAQSHETVVAFSFRYRLPPDFATALPVGDIEHLSRLATARALLMKMTPIPRHPHILDGIQYAKGN